MKYPKTMFNIGFRAHDFGSFNSASELANVVSEVKSPAVIQLALNKVIPSARKWTQWDEEYISSIRDDLAAKGVSAAVVGCYINPVHPDKDEREQQLQRFKRSLELNKAFGCKVVGTETGSWTPKITYSPETYEEKVFETLLNSIDFMLNQAIKNDAICAIEPVAFPHTMCTVERTVRVLDKFQDEHLKLIFDPINLVPRLGIPELDGSYRAIPSQEAQLNYITTCLDAFKERLCIIHCKDYILNEDGLKKGDLPVTTGVFRWDLFFKELRKRNLYVPILLENHNPKTLKETLATLNKF